VVSSTEAFLMMGLAFQLMSKNLNSELKKNTILPLICQDVGSRDHPERWDAKFVMAGRMGRSL
jgi:hypothetical protein